MRSQSISAVILSFCLFLMLPFTCIAGSDDRDSTYIKEYDNKFTAKLFLKDNFVSIIADHDGREYTYKTNRPLGLGVGFYYKKYGLSLSYGFNFLRNSRKGDTKSIDIQYSYYGRSCVIDVIAQSHRGMYLDNRFPGQDYIIYPMMRVCRAGIDYLHIFNSDRFSFKSAFGNSEKQIMSAGTWFAGAEVIGGMLTNDGLSITMFHCGPVGGYAYNWIFSRDFYLNVSASLGIDMVWTDRDFNLTPSSMVRLGVGYDNGLWAIYMNYRNSIIYPVVASTGRVGVSSGVLSLGTLVRI